MVAGSNGDAMLIQDRADVVGMNSIYDKRNDAGLLPRIADHAYTRNRRDHASRVLEQVSLVFASCFHADTFEVIDRGAEADAARNVGGSRLELVGQRVVSSALEAHRAN